MDDIEKRLRDAADNCIKHYSAWHKDKKMGADRDSLLESVHELRKVAARLEIDIAVSERTEMGARPLPIPPHRSSGRRGPGSDDNIGNEAEGDSFGNHQPDDSGPPQPRSNAGRDPRRPGGQHPRRQGGGGGGGRPQG